MARKIIAQLWHHRFFFKKSIWTVTKYCIWRNFRYKADLLIYVSFLNWNQWCILCFISGGYDIPKGTTVFINHWALHNDNVFWKNAAKFDPNRFLDSEGKMDKKPENWLPFSAGRRVCLGEPVARTELLLIATNLLQTFEFKAPPGEKIVLSPTLEFTGSEVPSDYKVVIKQRK